MFVIYEHRYRSLLYRRKVCYSVEGKGQLQIAGSAVTVYRPIERNALAQLLHAHSLSPITFTRRPGRWPMAAVIARKV